MKPPPAQQVAIDVFLEQVVLRATLNGLENCVVVTQPAADDDDRNLAIDFLKAAQGA